MINSKQKLVIPSYQPIKNPLYMYIMYRPIELFRMSTLRTFTTKHKKTKKNINFSAAQSVNF